MIPVVFNSTHYLKDDTVLMAKRLRALANAAATDPDVRPDDRAALEKCASDAEATAKTVNGFAVEYGIE